MSLLDVENCSDEEYRNASAAELSRRGCRFVDCYERLNTIDEGTYGVVHRARDRRTGDVYALKRVKLEGELSKEGFPVSGLRECATLLAYPHENVVRAREMCVGRNRGEFYLVMEFVDHDVRALMARMPRRFSTPEVKCLMQQLLRGVAHLHAHWILHRDLKSSNLLYASDGTLKLADFGLARHFGSPLRPATPLVVSLWYRAPELLLGTDKYAAGVDLWSVGCLFAEFLAHKPLFESARSDVALLDAHVRLLGTPTAPSLLSLPNARRLQFAQGREAKLAEQFCDISPAGLDLLGRFLDFDADARIGAADALSHAYFAESPRAQHTSMMPTWPSSSTSSRLGE